MTLEKMKKINVLYILFFLLALSSCNKKSRFAIDTSKERIEVKINRFDSALITLDTLKKNNYATLSAKYPDFFQAFISEVLDVPAEDTLGIEKLFSHYLNDKKFIPVNKKALETFNNISDIESSVSEAFTIIHHYFPEVTLPEIYFYVSGFNRSILLSNKFIGIGTDMYLGSDFPAYKDISYNYQLYGMRRECLATDIVSATLFRMFPMNSQQERLLDNMIHRGKVMYLLSVVMPTEKAADLMGYTPEQWEWCNKFHKDCWTSIIDNKHLFSTDLELIRKYMNEAPFTAPISQESPGRLGTWIGWQIVDSYMKNNNDIGLRKLMDESNYQIILEKSGYKP